MAQAIRTSTERGGAPRRTARWLSAAAVMLGGACSPRTPTPAGVGSVGPQAALRPSATAAPSAADVGAAAAGSPAASSTPAVTASLEATSAAVPQPPPGMLYVPGGTFVMGQDSLGEDDERPAHPVTVAAFFLDTTEVPNEAYGACVATGACQPPDASSAARNQFGSDARFRAARQPASAVGWEDARAYCAFAGKRLPTEAEWERAARGDDARRYPWGEAEPTPERAVFATGTTAEVGSRPAGAGPYGHLDLAGNVWEWLADEYDPYAYRRPTADRGVPGSCPEILGALDELRRLGKQGATGSNPIPSECEHVLRGGAFNYPAAGLRSSNRVHHPGRMRLVMAGIRCAEDTR